MKKRCLEAFKKVDSENRHHLSIKVSAMLSFFKVIMAHATILGTGERNFSCL